MKKSLIKQLVQLSREYGSDPTQVIAGGGNSSVKDGKSMWVKASGTSMATMEPEDLLEVDLEAVLAVPSFKGFSTDRDEKENQIAKLLLDARINPADPNLRPSVETVLHALLPHAFVMHTHGEIANSLTCSRGGPNLFSRLKLPKSVHAVWMEYVDPGLPLAIALRDLLAAYEKDHGHSANVVFMAKHGILFAADAPEEINALNEACEKAIQALAGKAKKGPKAHKPLLPPAARMAALRLLLPAFRSQLATPNAVVRPMRDSAVAELVNSPAGQELATGGPICPDQVVYCGTDPLWLPVPRDLGVKAVRAAVEDSLEKFRKAHRGQDPKVVLIPGVGGYAAGPTLKDTETIAAMYTSCARVMKGTQAFGGVKPLNERERTFIDTWSAEQYRRKKAKSSAASVRALNVVALVTGSGQGVGKELAQGLAANGALIVCVDMNAATAAETARELSAQYGAGTAVSIPADVTKEEQIDAAMTFAVEEYGGVDLAISNAGILHAFKVTDFSADAWRRIIDVNLVGGFLCMKAAALVMQPAQRGNIVQINSKSGKIGSKYNSAYASSKFGGIGLVQSLALDLIEDGIRVNAICPGNFFDLPLWSAPGGLFDQYRKKFNNAPREEVRKIYESKVPMGRGARVSDVVKTILYILEQEYETGQAYNVTGGQEMR